MTPGDFVRITRPPYAGMTGTVVLDGGTFVVVTLTSTGERITFYVDDVRLETRTSDQEATR